jgi:hypothetical protein
MHDHEMLFNITFLANSYTGIAYQTHTLVIIIDEEILILQFLIKIMLIFFRFMFITTALKTIFFSFRKSTRDMHSFVRNIKNTWQPHNLSPVDVLRDRTYTANPAVEEVRPLYENPKTLEAKDCLHHELFHTA